MNNKGFTLIEVIVTVTILGIVSVVALPVINSISGSMNKAKLDVYRGTIESAAKLYVDSKGIDLFGYNASGCVDIKYNDLVNSELVEKIDFTEFGVDQNNVFVRVEKNNDKYNFVVYFPKNNQELREIGTCNSAT